MRITRLFFFALAVAAAPALAQPDNPALRAKVRTQVRVAIEQRLAQILQLDADSAARLSSVIDRSDAQVAQVQADLGAAHRELKQLYDSGRADAASVDRIADRVLADKDRVQQLEHDRDREVRRALTPLQYGRLLVAWPQVNREVRKELWKAAASTGAESDH